LLGVAGLNGPDRKVLHHCLKEINKIALGVSKIERALTLRPKSSVNLDARLDEIERFRTQLRATEEAFAEAYRGYAGYWGTHDDDHSSPRPDEDPVVAEE
jgi:hypothetical protein